MSVGTRLGSYCYIEPLLLPFDFIGTYCALYTIVVVLVVLPFLTFNSLTIFVCTGW